MTNITIRDVPDDVHTELVARAAAAGQSLQAFLTDWIRSLAAKPDPAQLMRVARERVAESDAHVTTEDILRWRDEGRA